MQNIFKILSLFFISSTLSAQTEEIDKILGQNVTDDQKRALLSDPEIRKEIHYALMSQLSKDWGDPSLERVAVANEIGLEISKNFTELFRLAKTTNERQPYDLNLLSLLSFSASNEEIYQILREEGERRPVFNHKKRELLYNIGALKQKDIAEIVNEFENATGERHLRALAVKYADWGIPEAERYFAALLASSEPEKKSYISKFGNFTGGEFHSVVRIISSFYSHLGYLPDDVRRRVKELLETDPKILGEYIKVHLEKVLMIAEGELKKDSKLRMNGKGALDLSNLPNEIIPLKKSLSRKEASKSESQNARPKKPLVEKAYKKGINVEKI